MKNGKAAERIRKPVERRGEMLYFADYLQPREGRRTCRKRQRLGRMIEGVATVALALCGVYWIWHCMCCV